MSMDSDGPVPAGVGRRAVAKIIDTALFGWIAYQLSDAWLVLSLGPEAWDYYSPTAMSFSLLQNFFVLGPPTFVSLQIVFLLFWGATPGKLLCGLRIVTAEGTSLGLWKSAKRALAELLSFFVLGLGYIAPWGQTWHDKIAGTFVVEVKSTRPVRLGGLRRWLGLVAAGLLLALGSGIETSAPAVYRWRESFVPLVDRYIRDGVLAEQNGDFPRALEKFAQAIKANPRSSLAYADRGLLHAHMGNPDRAIEDFSKALELDSTQVFAYLGRADAYRRRGLMAEAFADYSAAIRLRPGWSGLVFAYRGRGAVHYRLGRFESAAADFGKGATVGITEHPHFVGGDFHEQMCKVFRNRSLRQLGDSGAAGRESAFKEPNALPGGVGAESDVAEWLGE